MSKETVNNTVGALLAGFIAGAVIFLNLQSYGRMGFVWGLKNLDYDLLPAGIIVFLIIGGATFLILNTRKR